MLIRLYRLIILLAVVALIYAHQQKKPPPDATAITVDRAKTHFPSASTIDPPSGSHGVQKVFNKGQKLLGYALQTSPEADYQGYSGPTNVLIALDSTGKLIGTEILDTSDTQDHVKDILSRSKYWAQFEGLTLGSPGQPQIDAVSGSTLTSHAITRSIIKRLGGSTSSLLFPTEILLAEIKIFLPEAERLEDHPDWPGVKYIYDPANKILGHALRTAPSQENLTGYQGPTDVLILLDTEAKKVTHLRFRKSYDNEEYYERILDDETYLQLYSGKTIDEVLRAENDIHTISGATHTSWAIAESVRRRLAQLKADQQPTPRQIPWRNITLIALTLGACLFSFTQLRGRPIPRLIWQITAITTLGLLLGDLLSQALFIGWAKHGLPWQQSWGLICLTASAFIIPWATGHQLYCHHMCPHGLLQHWFTKLRLPRLKIPKKLHQTLSCIPLLLLTLILSSLFLGFTINPASLEPFDTWLWRSAGLATILISIIGLLSALFIPLAYCKYGCPTGLLFKFLRSTSGTQSFHKRDLIALILVISCATLYLI